MSAVSPVKSMARHILSPHRDTKETPWLLPDDFLPLDQPTLLIWASGSISAAKESATGQNASHAEKRGSGVSMLGGKRSMPEE